jgi:hypothetical protein
MRYQLIDNRVSKQSAQTGFTVFALIHRLGFTANRLLLSSDNSTFREFPKRRNLHRRVRQRVQFAIRNSHPKFLIRFSLSGPALRLFGLPSPVAGHLSGHRSFIRSPVIVPYIYEVRGPRLTSWVGDLLAARFVRPEPAGPIPLRKPLDHTNRHLVVGRQDKLDVLTQSRANGVDR